MKKITSTLITQTLGSISIPYETQGLIQPGGLFYGTNAMSNKIIVLNKRKLDNPNSFILGASGVGKSFKVKQDIVLNKRKLDNPNSFILGASGSGKSFKVKQDNYYKEGD